MTVSSKLQQTIASAESVAANLKSFALDTEDKQAGQMYSQWAQMLDTCVIALKSRLQYIQQEEPQYKQS